MALISPLSFAQQSVIDHCKQTSSDSDRIACLEAAILGKDLPTPPTARAESVAPVETVAPQPKTEPEGIGAGQVVTRAQSTEERLERLEKAEGLVVASYGTVPYERLVVTFENGQVWRQIRGDTTRIRVNLDRNQTADITESSLGGYKLRLNEIRRTLRVERIK